MAETANDPGMFWVEPELRGILPLDSFHIPRSLKKAMRNSRFRIFVDRDFPAVIAACAEKTKDRKQTWINQRIQKLYCELHESGHANSIEVYDGEELVGGLYGVSLGRAFFGESMFSRKRDASKFALVHLVYLLRRAGFVLLDTQFTTAHLERFGVVEIPKNEYHEKLEEALHGRTTINPDGYQEADGGAMSDSCLQSFNQIS